MGTCSPSWSECATRTSRRGCCRGWRPGSPTSEDHGGEAEQLAGAGAGNLPEGVRAADGRRAAGAVGGPGGGPGAAGEEGARPRSGRADARAAAGGEERLREGEQAALLAQAADARAGGATGSAAEAAARRLTGRAGSSTYPALAVRGV